MSINKRFFGVLALAMVNTAYADEAEHHIAFTAWAVSDYVFRGLSQTYEDPALQAAIDYTHKSGFYAGAWASPVDFHDQSGADLELDLYVGFNHKFNETVTGDIELIRYNYPGTNDGVNLAYNELIGKLTLLDHIIATVGYSNDVFSSGHSGIYYNLGGYWMLQDFKLSAGVGHYQFNSKIFTSGDGYSDLNFGVSRAFNKLEAALIYTDTNGSGHDIFGKIADDRIVLSLKYSF